MSDGAEYGGRWARLGAVIHYGTRPHQQGDGCYGPEYGQSIVQESRNRSIGLHGNLFKVVHVYLLTKKNKLRGLHHLTT